MLTQGYTPEIAGLVHKSIVLDIGLMNKAKDAKACAYKDRAILSIGIDEMDEATALAVLG